jgi:hypothetical protein
MKWDMLLFKLYHLKNSVRAYANKRGALNPKLWNKVLCNIYSIVMRSIHFQKICGSSEVRNFKINKFTKLIPQAKVRPSHIIAFIGLTTHKGPSQHIV